MVQNKSLMCVPDACVPLREGGAERERLDVSTWLIIQSDYPCLAAGTGRPLSTPSLLPLWTSRHLSGWDDSAEDQPQTGRYNPTTPSLTSHHQCCPGHGGHLLVQSARRPPVWRRQLVEAAANRDVTGLPECTVNSIQREITLRHTHIHLKSNRHFSLGFTYPCNRNQYSKCVVVMSCNLSLFSLFTCLPCICDPV